MENFDPMGIHTGDSIVVAPSQTLSNAEYYRLRDCALKMIRHLGVIGECNIQYAVDPKSDQFRIIEVNARLSRSSALASKATGYPLAYVAAKLGLGHDLVQLRNAVTKSTTACFEPSLDYCVVKIPRWDLKKFVTVDKHVGSCMKSVGEIMAIGRTFEETMQKALRMVDESCNGFDADRFDLEAAKGNVATLEEVKVELADPSPVRVFAIAKAFEYGLGVHEVHDLTKIDRWFLMKGPDGKWANGKYLYNVHNLSKVLQQTSFIRLKEDARLLDMCKRAGFSDKQIAKLMSSGLVGELTKAKEVRKKQLKVQDSIDALTTLVANNNQLISEEEVRNLRYLKSIHPCVKQVDTVAGEFPAETNYLYLTYNGDEHDVNPIKQGLRRAEIVAQAGSPRYRMRTPSKPSQYYKGLPAGAPDFRLNVLQPERSTTNASDSGITDLPLLGGAGGATSPEDYMSPSHNGAGGEHSFNPGMRVSHITGKSSDPGGSVIVLGCGCYRIGSSVEFDWCCVQAIKTIHKAGRPAIVINCNPETVSTDYDESDRLYFDELSHETVLEIYNFENPYGLVISVGGQVPNNLAMGLAKTGLVKILGTSVAAIDSAENRFKFSQLCDKLAIDQPEWSEFSTYQEALEFCKRVDFPVLVRPSYVLSGAAMRVVDSAENLYEFLRSAAIVSRDYPVVISKYVENAKEVEFDGVACSGDVVNYA
eukprot:g646.t1